MNCVDVRISLIQQSDEPDALREHLSHCPSCAALARFMREGESNEFETVSPLLPKPDELSVFRVEKGTMVRIQRFSRRMLLARACSVAACVMLLAGAWAAFCSYVQPAAESVVSIQPPANEAVANDSTAIEALAFKWGAREGQLSARPAEAARQIEELLAQDVDSAAAERLLAHLQALRKQNLNRAESAAVLKALSACQEKLDRWDSGTYISYAQAAALDTDWTDQVRSKIAQLARQKQQENALELLGEMGKLRPDTKAQEWSQYYLASFMWDRGNTSDAFDVCLRLSQTCTDANLRRRSCDLLLNLARTTERRAQAMPVFEHVFNHPVLSDDKAYALYQRGWLLKETGNFAEALAVLQRCSREYSDLGYGSSAEMAIRIIKQEAFN